MDEGVIPQTAEPGYVGPEPPNGNGHATYEQREMLRTLQSELRSLTTAELLARYQFARQAGLTFDGNRDEYQILGYDRIITTKQYRDEYARGGIAGRIVDALPNATWRGQVELIEDENPDIITPFEQAWLDLDQRLKVQAKLHRVDKLAGLSHYAILLIGAAGDLGSELPRATKPNQLLYLTPFSGGGGPAGPFGSAQSREQATIAAGADATIWEYETDPQSERFGLPLSYRVTRLDIQTPHLMRPVHWTRVIHIAEGLMDDDVFGQPALERVWNLLIDLRKVTGGGAEAFWLRANQGLHVDVDKDMNATDAAFAIEKLKEQRDAYKHQLDRWLRTKGTKVEVLGSDVANFANPAEAILTQIAGAKAIPKRILMGSEMGELASSQDRDNWRDQVNGRQTGYAAPFIVRPLVDRLVEYGYMPAPKKGPTNYEVRWPQIATLTEEEKTKGASAWAQVNQAYGDVVFTDDEIREKWADKAPLSPEQRKQIDDRAAEKLKQQQEAMAAATPPEEKKEPVARAAKLGAEYKLSSTQVQLPPRIASKLLAYGAQIPDDELAAAGRENDAHITVKYGLHTNDPAQVVDVLRDEDSVDLVMGRLAAFTAHPDHDVLYVAVGSDCLHRLNKALSQNLEVTDTHPVYTPHATIAYLKKGAAEKYVGDDSFAGMRATIGTVLFSSADGVKCFIPLRSKAERTFLDENERELAEVLRDAIEAGATEVVEAIVGLGGPGSGNFGHAGRPGQVGGSSPSGLEIGRARAAAALGLNVLADLVAGVPNPDDFESIIKAEELLRARDTEMAVVYQGRTPLVTYTMNSKGAVFLPKPSTPEGRALRGTTITHNHPSLPGMPAGTNLSFSIADLKSAVTHNLKEIRAVTPDGTFSLKRLGDSWPRGITRYAQQRWRSSLTDSSDVAAFFNDVWQRGVAREYAGDVSYSFEPKESM